MTLVTFENNPSALVDQESLEVGDMFTWGSEQSVAIVCEVEFRNGLQEKFYISLSNGTVPDQVPNEVRVINRVKLIETN